MSGDAGPCLRCGTVARIGDAHLCIPRMSGKTRAMKPQQPLPGVQGSDGLSAIRDADRPAEAVSAKRVLITGSRTWNDVVTIRHALLAYDGPGVTLVSGHCPDGADRLCEVVAERLGWTIERHPAAWSRYGRRAGRVRNVEMARAGADVCLAFHRGGSPGTAHMIEEAERWGIPVIRFDYSQPVVGA